MLQIPKCVERECKHFMGIIQPDGTEATEAPYCKAFPKGIPVKIAYGNNLHTNSFPGDKGIQYEKRK